MFPLLGTRRPSMSLRRVDLPEPLWPNRQTFSPFFIFKERETSSFSPYEKALRNTYKNITPQMRQEFNAYKKEMNWLLEPKALYRALREINGNYNYNEWNNIDRNLS